MGQQEVIEILEEANVPLSLSEISDRLGENKVTIAHTLSRMLKYKNSEIKCIEIDRKLSMKFFRCSRRMTLYYV